MSNLLDVSGRRVLVTGASSGIGRETAVLLSKLGASVIVNGRDERRLSETVAALAPGSHSAEIFDLASCEDIPRWIRTLADKAGPLDGLVHAAGRQMTMPVQFLSASQTDELLRTNVTSSLMLARGYMQKRCHNPGGSVVFVSSVMSIVSRPALAAYSASKAALAGLTRSLALEFAKDRVRVNCVAPAFVETPMLEQLRESVTPQQFQALQDAHPLGFGTPQDVAGVIAFLLADAARWITGSSVVVDGGYSIT